MFWFSLLVNLLELTASFNAFPGLNTGTLAALISNLSPVLGFLPTLAALSLTEKVPNPFNVT